MSAKTRYNVANSSICFFCFKAVEKSNLKKRNNTELCQRFYKMLQPSTHTHNNGSLKSSSSKWKNLSKDNTLCSKACSDCMTIIDMHCQLHFELQCVQMKLQWQLKKLSSVMRCANKVPSRLKQFRKNLEEFGNKDDLQFSTQFRTYVIERCNTKWKHIGPSLKLNRIDRAQKTEKNSLEMEHNEETSLTNIVLKEPLIKENMPGISDSDAEVVDTSKPEEIHVDDTILPEPEVDLDNKVELEEKVLTDKHETVLVDETTIESDCNESNDVDIVNKVNETKVSIDLDESKISPEETSTQQEIIEHVQNSPVPIKEDNLCSGDPELLESTVGNTSEGSVTSEKIKDKKKAKEKVSESQRHSRKRKSSVSPAKKDACTDTIGISSNTGTKTFDMLLQKSRDLKNGSESTNTTENNRRTSSDNKSIGSSDENETIFQEPKDLIEIPLLHMKQKQQDTDDEYQPNETEEQLEDSGSEFDELPPKKRIGYANKQCKKKTV